ncbi:FAD-dependent monooxygenase [Polaribacter pectinis]|uniref:FAD-dependent monooxygenase n=1 Tax=Polaribacter pectinis TaxID=2738844 RepID=A0A7G9L6D9_9FLAO|nr:FAD-dependent monooxygenase [Polaribacter pectinis]QNM84188.1 FAD-dependent monooxygenase [Polaribacter pectinis]
MYTIIGAGIGGLTTALAFEKKGIPYQVFEKAPELNEVGAGIWLAPNALQVLESLNILEEVKKNGNAINRITIGKSDLSPLSDIQQDIFKDKFGFTTVSIHRAALQKLLFHKIPKDKITLNKGFQSYKELNSEKIEVTFNDNSKIETNFLIGADGINSKVRNQLFPNSSKRYSGQTCWRGIVDFKLEEKYAHRGFELWGNQIRFGISEVAKDKVYWFAVVLAEENSKEDTSKVKEKLLNLFSDFDPLIVELISETPIQQILKNDINDLKPLSSWYKGNICLIGDAGHATTPNMGQGGAQAIEDAYYLSNLIKEYSGKNVFKLFQERRQKKVNTVVNQSWSTGKIAHWKYGKSFRNLVLQNMPKKILEKKMFEMYHIDKF